MNADLDSLTQQVLGAVFEVSNTLGAGFLEKVYERALLRELMLRGIRASNQASLAVVYKGCPLGEYFADLLVEEAVIVELKACSRIASEHEAQLLNYLRATPYEVGLLLNFGTRPEFRRRAFDNGRKRIIW